MKVKNDLRTRKIALNALTVVFTVISLVYVFPVLMVLLNSFKGNTFVKTETFAFGGGATKTLTQYKTCS